MIFIIVLLLLFFLSYTYDIKGFSLRKYAWYKIVLVLFIVIAGIRYRVGGDTIAYLYFYYNQLPNIWEFSMDEISKYHYEPLYLLLNMVVKSVGGKFFIVQLIHASIVNILIFKYFKKHCRYVFLCILIYYVWMYALFSYEIIRASLSVAICLFATDAIIEKRWLKGYLLYFVGIGFHLSAIVMLVLPFLLFLKANKFGYIALLVAYVFGIWLASHINEYLILFEMSDSTSTSAKLDVYMDSGDLTTSFNLQGLLVYTLPALLYPIVSLNIVKKKNDEYAKQILLLEPLVMIGLLFNVMTTSVLMLYRVSYFFVVYLIIYYAELTAHIIQTRSEKIGNVAILYAIIILLPFINISTSYYRAIANNGQTPVAYNYKKYIPYSTVIDRTKDPVRENVWGGDYPTTEEEY